MKLTTRPARPRVGTWSFLLGAATLVAGCATSAPCAVPTASGAGYAVTLLKPGAVPFSFAGASEDPKRLERRPIVDLTKPNLLADSEVEASGVSVGGEGGKAGGSASASDIAKELANPTAVVGKMSLNFDHGRYDGTLPGATNQSSSVLLFQPSFPYPIGDGMSIVARPAIPIILNQPVFGGTDFSNEGVELGDIGFDFGYSGPIGGGFIMLAGMVGTLPTATKRSLGRSQLSLGPEFLLGRIFDWGVLGALVTHQWDVASTSSSAKKVNITSGQYFYTFLLDDGWVVGAGPAWSYNWEAASGSRLTLPLGIGFSKTTVIGKTPWKFGVEAYYYVERPDQFAQEWSLRFIVSPVVPLPWGN